jgi:glycosyltransferase involved in cell wall biosynthesis
VIRLVYAESADPFDGIRRYAQHCCGALRSYEGLPAQLDLWAPDQELAHIDAGDIIVLQYNPFSYGRRGFAPWLVRRVRHVRRNLPGARIVLVVHEAYVPAHSLRWALMGTWQRGQLALLARTAHGIVISTESWRRRVSRLAGAPPIAAIPVGSNLPDATSARSQTRQANGWTEETLVVAALGGDEAARLTPFITAAIHRLGQTHRKVVFANLGAAPIRVPDLQGIAHHRPGALDDDSLARELGAADVFLAPYEDGVSLRRTTLAAALQHALAVIGTDGRNTEVELRDSSALRLAPVREPTEFAEAAMQIARDVSVRQELGARGRQLFDRRLAWPVIAANYRAALEAVAGGSIV